MPFKSEAQRRWMYAKKPEMAKRWQEHTGSKDLPERARVISAAKKMRERHGRAKGA